MREICGCGKRAHSRLRKYAHRGLNSRNLATTDTLSQRNYLKRYQRANEKSTSAELLLETASLFADLLRTMHGDVFYGVKCRNKGERGPNSRESSRENLGSAPDSDH